MPNDRNQRFNRGITKGTNTLIALFWLVLGIGGMIAGASGYGGAFGFILGLCLALYGLYGLYRHVLS